MNKYDAKYVDIIRDLEQQGAGIDAMMEATGLDVRSISALRRDGRQHGWDQIRDADLNIDDDEVDEEEADYEQPTYEMEIDDRPVYDADDDNAAPDIAHEAAQQAAKHSGRRKTTKTLPRGKKPPARQNNKRFNAANRRRKSGDLSEHRRRLIADTSKLDPDYTYRWVLDKPGRLRQLTQFDDWEPVTDAHMIEGQGGNVSVPAGDNHYQADSQVLLRKPKVWQEADRAEAQRSLTTFEKQIEDGTAAQALSKQYKSEDGGSVGDGFYTPSDRSGERNSVSRS
jgi:hypothetical protein